MKKRFAVILALVLTLVSIVACGGNSEEKETTEVKKTEAQEETVGKETEGEEKTEAEVTEAEAGKDSVKVGLVILSGDHGFTGESVKHAEMEADILMEKYDNVDIIVKSCGEAADQITEIENLISMGDIDAIMLWPTEGEALRSAAQTVVDAGIKLFIYDRLIEDFDGLEAQMMGDNFSIGHEMGIYLDEYFADNDTVNYLRFVGDSSTVTSQRSDGMDDVISADKFVQVNETFVTDWSTEKAQEQMENWLNAQSKEDIESLELIVTHDDEIVDGLMNALENYNGDAEINVKLITSVGGREGTLQKFEGTDLDVKFITWFFAPSFIRECVDMTVESALGEPFSGTAELSDGIYLIPSFSISNAENATYTFDEYRASEAYEIRYSIDE